jgi:undecaprenyl diphosphate synthase
VSVLGAGRAQAAAAERAEGLQAELDPARLPRHVAIIMDGNGRWARRRRLPRIMGHQAAPESVRAVIEAAGEIGVKALTLYTFSAENWRRPKREVAALMELIEHNLRRELEELNEKGVRVRHLGRKQELPASLQRELARAEETTAGNQGLGLNLAINYGARQEIAEAAARLAEAARAGRLAPEQIDEAALAGALYLQGMPDPDLLIRTGGEMRVSNFLLWQIAYAEICVTPVLWPDFRREHFLEALLEYQRRKRRFGGLDHAV